MTYMGLFFIMFSVGTIAVVITLVVCSLIMKQILKGIWK